MLEAARAFSWVSAIGWYVLDGEGDVSSNLVLGRIWAGARRRTITGHRVMAAKVAVHELMLGGDDVGFADRDGLHVEIEVLGLRSLFAADRGPGWIACLPVGLGVGLAVAVSKYVDGGEDFPQQCPDRGEVGNVYRHCRLAEVPVHVNVGNKRRDQAVNGSEYGGDDHECAHPKDYAQNELLLQRQPSLHDGRDTKGEDQDIGGDVEDRVDNLVILVRRALSWDSVSLVLLISV